MLTLDTLSDCTLATTPTRGARAGRYFANVLAGIRDGGAMHARYEELARLSNTDLAQRGLARGDIMRAVLAGQ
jgi:hypothetical protein